MGNFQMRVAYLTRIGNAKRFARVDQSLLKEKERDVASTLRTELANSILVESWTRRVMPRAAALGLVLLTKQGGANVPVTPVGKCAKAPLLKSQCNLFQLQNRPVI